MFNLVALFLTKTPDTHYSTEGGGVIEEHIFLHFLWVFLLLFPGFSILISVAKEASRATKRIRGSPTVDTQPRYYVGLG